MNSARSRARRLQQEFAIVNKEGEDEFSAQLQDSDLGFWIVQLRGPKDSPYENGTFILHVRFPSKFPFVPPIVTFRTRIYHPNIDRGSGTIAWSLGSTEWSPSCGMNKNLIVLQNILMEPNPLPDCEAEPEVGHEWRARHELFWQTAKEWTEKYAINGQV